MPDREIDLEIVSASWQSLTDTEGYDRMMEAWDRKLAHAARSPGLLDRILVSLEAYVAVAAPAPPPPSPSDDVTPSEGGA